MFDVTYYYWGPGATGNQYFQQPFFGQGQFQQQTPPSVSSGNFITPYGTVMPTSSGSGRQEEESYIENILRENIGNIGTFYFTVPSSQNSGDTQGNVIKVRGTVLQAGRDHAIIREANTNHVYLFPMIYFDFARFEEGFRYISPQRRTPPQR